jgi:hypothetical protein
MACLSSEQKAGQFTFSVMNKCMDLDGLDNQNIEDVLSQGGRLVFYEFCISLIFITLRRPSKVYLAMPGRPGVLRALPYCLISFLLGWWGLPWGPIYTVLTIVTNLRGGCDISAQWMTEKLKKSP